MIRNFQAISIMVFYALFCNIIKVHPFLCYFIIFLLLTSSFLRFITVFSRTYKFLLNILIVLFLSFQVRSNCLNFFSKNIRPLTFESLFWIRYYFIVFFFNSLWFYVRHFTLLLLLFKGIISFSIWVACQQFFIWVQVIYLLLFSYFN